MKAKLLILLLFSTHFLFAQVQRLKSSSNNALKYEIEFANNLNLRAERNQTPFSGKTIQPPLSTLTPGFQHFTIDTKKIQPIRLSSGTKIIVPPAAFLDANGKVVQGEVELRYREYNSGWDIMRSGIPMGYKDKELESAAMFEIGASQGTQELFPNSEAPIEILFPSTPVGSDFSFYRFDEERGEWEDRGTEEISEGSEAVDNFFESLIGGSGWQSREEWNRTGFVNPTCIPGGLELQVYKNKFYEDGRRKQGLVFQFDFNRRANKRGFVFEEWEKFSKMRWQYVGDQSYANRRAIKKQMRKLKFHYWGSIEDREAIDKRQVMNCWIEPDLQKDCFLFKVVTVQDTFSFPVTPLHYGKNDLREQKVSKKFYAKYQKRLANRRTNWESNLNNLFIPINAEFVSNDTSRVTARKVEVMVFGLCNIDRMLSLQSEDILVECSTGNGEILKIEMNYIWNNTANVALRGEGSTIRIPTQENNQAIFKFDDGLVAIISPSDFKKAYSKKKNDTIRFEVTPVQENEILKPIGHNLFSSRL